MFVLYDNDWYVHVRYDLVNAKKVDWLYFRSPSSNAIPEDTHGEYSSPRDLMEMRE